MKNTDRGFAVIVALLVLAIMSAVAAAAFFISTSDLKISLNRLQANRSLRDAERILAESQMTIERCLEKNSINECAGQLEDSVNGTANAVLLTNGGISLSVTGRSGNFSANIEAEYSVEKEKLQRNSWRQNVEENQ